MTPREQVIKLAIELADYNTSTANLNDDPAKIEHLRKHLKEINSPKFSEIFSILIAHFSDTTGYDENELQKLFNIIKNPMYLMMCISPYQIICSRMLLEDIY